MKTFVVKKEIGKEEIQKEQDHKKQFLHRKGVEWWIQNEDGKDMICIKKEGEQIQVTGSICGNGIMKMEKEHPYFQPARVKTLCFLENNEKYTLAQTPKREYTIYQNDQVIGKIEGLDGWKTQIWTEDQVSDEMAGLCYGLAKVMYHQDDVILV